MRHGQSTWNLVGRLQGQTVHPPLTDQGRADAHAAAGRLIELGVTGSGVLYCSDQVRAMQTADIVGARLGLTPHPEPALREQGLGELEGRQVAELHAEPVPPDRHISEIRWGGGESIADVYSRVGEFFLRVMPGERAPLVVVSHGDTIRVALAWLSGRSHREVSWDPVPNGAVVTAVVTDRVWSTDLQVGSAEVTVKHDHPDQHHGSH